MMRREEGLKERRRAMGKEKKYIYKEKKINENKRVEK